MASDELTRVGKKSRPTTTDESDSNTTDCATRSALRRVFCPFMGRVAGASQQLTDEDQTLLHSRLRAVSLLVLIATAVFTVRGFALGAMPFLGMQLIELAILALASTILVTRQQLTLGQLRGLELLVFGSLSIHIFVICYRLSVFLAASGNDPLVASSLYRDALGYLALIAAYGMFIPNTWQRAAAFVTPMAIAPFAVTGLLWKREPAVAAVFDSTLGFEDLSFTMLVMAIGAATMIYGAHTIHATRADVARVREMGMYQLGEKIGAGGMGEVWKAEHRMLARPAAIKMIKPEMLGPGGDTGTAVKRFEREARATAALRSPHTVELYDFGVTRDHTFYYVMEYLEGMNLDTLIKHHGPQPPERVVHLLQQAIQSLAEAHDKGLVHRDIKPANMHVGTMGIEHDFLKVLDFGLVKLNRGIEPGSAQLTREDTTTGTPAYMPPEIALGKPPVDARTDIYALGCVAYWLLTGKPVFDSGSPMELIVDHVKTVPATPSERLGRAVPPPLETLIMQCLEKQQSARPQSMIEIGNRLDELNLEGWTQGRAAAWWSEHAPAAERLQVA